MGATLHVHALLKAHIDVAEPAIGVRIHDRMANLLFAAGNRQLNITLHNRYTLGVYRTEIPRLSGIPVI